MIERPAGYFNFTVELGNFWSPISLLRQENFRRFGALDMLSNLGHAAELQITTTPNRAAHPH
jgi:hypothetical protein